MLEATGEKFCWSCQRKRPLAEFRKNISSLDGFSRTCKNCQDILNETGKPVVTKIEKLYCPRCKQIKSTGEFSKDKNHKTGYTKFCSECLKFLVREQKAKEAEQKIREKLTDIMSKNKPKRAFRLLNSEQVGLALKELSENEMIMKAEKSNCYQQILIIKEKSDKVIKSLQARQG